MYEFMQAGNLTLSKEPRAKEPICAAITQLFGRALPVRFRRVAKVSIFNINQT
jgi:hypothetical protein